MLVIYITLALIASTVLGGLFAMRFKDKLHLILGFSAGAVLGVALFDLIPEALNLASSTYTPTFVMLFAGIGFAVYMLFDRLFSIHDDSDCHDEDCENTSHKGNFGLIALIFHSFLDGFAIGMAFKLSTQVGWVVAAAVLAHKFSDGINTVGLSLRNKKEGNEKVWLAASAVAPAFGVLATYLFTISQPTLGLVLAVFIGLFLYLSASDLIPESHHHHSTAWTSIFTIFGMILAYLAVHFSL